MDLRPKVPELVTHLERAAADWNGVMPPCVQVKYVTPDSGESMSDWMKHREFEILTLGNLHQVMIQVEYFNRFRMPLWRLPPTHKLPLDRSAT